MIPAPLRTRSRARATAFRSTPIVPTIATAPSLAKGLAVGLSRHVQDCRHARGPWHPLMMWVEGLDSAARRRGVTSLGLLALLGLGVTAIWSWF